MTFPSKFLPVVVFAIFLAITVAARKSGGTASSPAETPTPEQNTRITKMPREGSTAGEVRKLLRAGDLAGAHAALHKLANRDPVAFFKLLERLPAIPGMEDIIRDAAGNLPWNQPGITELLNRIGIDVWRGIAWLSYTSAHIGKYPDEEIFEVGIKARPSASRSGVWAVMNHAAENNPDNFLAYLNRIGGPAIREGFFELLMKFHPERAGDLYSTLPDESHGVNNDRSSILYLRARYLPTAENLMDVLGDLGNHGAYSADLAPLLTYDAYRHATPEEQEKILGAIAAQPPLARNRMLFGPIHYNSESLPTAEFTKLVGFFTSGHLQREALEQWMKSEKQLDPADRGWIEDLPTERLRARAHELLDAPPPPDSP